MNVKTTIATVGLGAVALGGLVGVGVSYADGPTATPSPTAPSSAAPSAPKEKAGRHLERAALKRALHGEATVGGKEKTRVIDFQRGAVEKISATSITVKSTDGFTATYVVDADTVVRHARQVAKITDVKTGDKVRVVALKQGATSTARVIGEPKG